MVVIVADVVGSRVESDVVKRIPVWNNILCYQINTAVDQISYKYYYAIMLILISNICK